MSEVITHHHPVEPPPRPTYDIVGLTENEMRLIVNLVAITSGDTARSLWGNLPTNLRDPHFFDAISTSSLALVQKRNGK